MEVLGLFLTGLLFFVFPTLGWKVVRFFLGTCALFACIIAVVSYFCLAEQHRNNEAFAKQYDAERAQAAEKWAKDRENSIASLSIVMKQEAAEDEARKVFIEHASWVADRIEAKLTGKPFEKPEPGNYHVDNGDGLAHFAN